MSARGPGFTSMYITDAEQHRHAKKKHGCLRRALSCFGQTQKKTHQTAVDAEALGDPVLAAQFHIFHFTGWVAADAVVTFFMMAGLIYFNSATLYSELLQLLFIGAIYYFPDHFNARLFNDMEQCLIYWVYAIYSAETHRVRWERTWKVGLQMIVMILAQLGVSVLALYLIDRSIANVALPTQVAYLFNLYIWIGVTFFFYVFFHWSMLHDKITAMEASEAYVKGTVLGISFERLEIDNDTAKVLAFIKALLWAVFYPYINAPLSINYALAAVVYNSDHRHDSLNLFAGLLVSLIAALIMVFLYQWVYARNNTEAQAELDRAQRKQQ
jgi:hypothetical protein